MTHSDVKICGPHVALAIDFAGMRYGKAGVDSMCDVHVILESMSLGYLYMINSLLLNGSIGFLLCRRDL